MLAACSTSKHTGHVSIWSCFILYSVFLDLRTYLFSPASLALLLILDVVLSLSFRIPSFGMNKCFIYDVMTTASACQPVFKPSAKRLGVRVGAGDPDSAGPFLMNENTDDSEYERSDSQVCQLRWNLFHFVLIPFLSIKHSFLSVIPWKAVYS